MAKNFKSKLTQKLGKHSALLALVYREICIIISLLAVFNIMLWVILHHEYAWILSTTVVIFSLFKVLYLLYFSMRRLKSCLDGCRTFYDVLGVYALLIGVMVLSFTVDYYCLMICRPNSFLLEQTAEDAVLLAFDFLYFSIVTFATIGYGDIVPMIIEAKLLVLLEISLSFVMITFVISNLRLRGKN